MRNLNLGILAHVDAGKTTLTERLLHAAGVIEHAGSVDAGTTQTDSLELERQRGITIKSAVVSFVVQDTTINLIDTPGHPDFIAEVERVLAVLDGAVLVISAVEGVQSQTRVLLKALQRLGIPTVLLVNKIDRRGADPQRVLDGIGARLTAAHVAMGAVREAGTPGAGFTPCAADDPALTQRLLDVLSTHDDSLVETYLRRGTPPEDLYARFREQVRRVLVHPVYFSSAATGAGVSTLMRAVAALLPGAAVPGAVNDVRGTVFKVDRGPNGEKIAYARLFAGELRQRQRVNVGGSRQKVTAIRVFDAGTDVACESVAAGRICKLWGLDDARIGDAIGAGEVAADPRGFAPPTLETLIAPVDPADKHALYAALAQLAEQDPLINLRQDDARQEMHLSLYGEVQKEVIQQTLANDFQLAVTFSETTMICTERVAGRGAAAEIIGTPQNPFLATVGLRVEPGPPDSGVTFRLEVELGSIRLSFHKAVEETVHETLQQGLYGWRVSDCIVTLTHSGYWPRQSSRGSRFDPSISSTAGDFRKLTPLVLMDALRQAGTQVHEPVHRFRLELPEDVLGSTLRLLARLQAAPLPPRVDVAVIVVEGHVPAARINELHRRLPGLTRGEGVLESEFAGYRPVTGVPPKRPRTDHNPTDRRQYLLNLMGLIA